MSRRLFLLFLLTLSLLLPLTAAAGEGLSFPNPFSSRGKRTIGFVPRTADNIGAELDAQVMRLLQPAGYGRSSVSISCTVPVYLGDFADTSPLARQMAEELSRYFVDQGYKVNEIRKGSEVVSVPRKGEFLLTRDTRKLQSRTVTTEMVLTGTYTVTDRSVRFNMRLLSTPTNEVVAMAAGTVPVTEELVPPLADPLPPLPLRPTVRTKLPR